MKILIFGGSGFLGRNLAVALANLNHSVTVFDLKKVKFLNKKVKFIKGNILNLSEVLKASRDKDIIYNFAGISDIGDALSNPIDTTKINILGSVNTLEAAVINKVKKYVFASTIYVLSRQGGFYKTSKQAVESFIDEYNKKHKLKYTILRFGSIYGEGADKRNGISRLVRSALKDKIISYGGTKKAERRFIYINDATKAAIKILNPQYNCKRVLITGDKKFKIKNLIVKLMKILNIKKRTIFKRKPMMGHYDKNPFNDKVKKQIIFYVRPSIDINAGLKKIIEEYK